MIADQESDAPDRFQQPIASPLLSPMLASFDLPTTPRRLASPPASGEGRYRSSNVRVGQIAALPFDDPRPRGPMIPALLKPCWCQLRDGIATRMESQRQH